MLEQPVLEHCESSGVPRFRNTQTLTVKWRKLLVLLVEAGQLLGDCQIYVSYLYDALGWLRLPM